VELRILGPLEVVLEGQCAAPSAGKQRSLLSFLILHANERVGADRLIDAIWGERPPATAPAALQNQVTRLRRLLGADRIETAGSTYLLRLAPGELDADRFEELVRRAGTAAPAERAELLGSALSLWRGRPLGGADELFAGSEIARLDELRLVAIEQRLDAELELGRSAALVPELDGLVGEHPLREGFRAKLMLALYRSGRQAEALQVYQQARALLVDELGIEPSQPLQLLHRRILLQDAGLDPAPLEAARPWAAPVLLPAVPPREVRKSATAVLLAVDLPALGDPELLRSIGARAAAAVRLAVERHGGRVQETLGAGALAVFGVPLLHEDDALRAVRAAEEARAALVGLDARLTLRVGVGTGVVIADADADATGQPVQSARELGRRAGAGEILLAPSTQLLVRDAVSCEPFGSDALRLLRLDPDAPGVARRLDAPLVDRERELLLLETAFAHAVRSSECQLFTVCGEAGIGKSRLVAELVRSLGDEATVLTGRCLAYGDGITYWPVLEIIRSAAGIGAEDAAGAGEQIAALVPGPDGARVGERLAGLLGFGPPPGAEEIAWSLQRLLEALAAVRPVVVVVDDLHHAEPTLLDLLEGIAGRSHGAPILIAGLARPALFETCPAWGGGMPNTMTVTLQPLDAHDSDLLLANLPGGSRLDLQLRAQVVGAAGGHPLFVEELLTMLSDQGRAMGGDDELSMPPTVQALLAARLERLPDGERRVLECGAVEGETFHAVALAALAPDLIPEACEAALAGLLRKDLLRSTDPQLADGTAYRFRHALVRDEAYASLPKARRALMHEAFASWLEQTAGGRLVELEEIIGYHLERAYRYRTELGPVDDEIRGLGERAADRLGAAGRRAQARGDARAGSSLFAAAADLASTRLERAGHLLRQGEAEREAWAFPRAEELLTRVRAEAIASSWPGLEAAADVELALVMLQTHPLEAVAQLREVGSRALATFEALGDDRGTALALILLAQERWLVLRCAEMEVLLERALGPAERSGDQRLVGEVLVGLGRAAVLGPRPADDAVERCERLIGRARGVGPLTVASISMMLTVLEASRGNAVRFRELGADSKAVMEELQPGPTGASAGMYLALALLIGGDADRAERELRAACDLLERLGERGHASTIAALHARALVELERHEEAERAVALALAWADADDVVTQAYARGARARSLAARGQIDDAIENARRAVEISSRHDALNQRGDALIDLSVVLDAAADRSGARRAAAEALELYRAKGNVVSADRAARLLDTIRTSTR
jgi:DNA-binding SARP family transcriptional activator